METINSKAEAQKILYQNILLELREVLIKMNDVSNDIRMLLMNGGLQ